MASGRRDDRAADGSGGAATGRLVASRVGAGEPPAHCVICGHEGRGEAAPFHMTHGICVWLCPTHRDPRYLRRRRGRTFTERLHAAWRAAGRTTIRHRAALAAHRSRLHPTPPRRRRPGSYSWPDLRRLAEARFAAGEDPHHVISDLRRTYRHDAARVPSVRTMRRWHAQGRWLHPLAPGRRDDTPLPRRRITWLRRPRVSQWPNLGYRTAISSHPLGIFLLLWVDDRPHTTHWRRP